jgi:hypothetical protein
MDSKKKKKPDDLKAWMHWGEMLLNYFGSRGKLSIITPALNKRVSPW